MSDVAVFVLKTDVKLQLTNWLTPHNVVDISCYCSCYKTRWKLFEKVALSFKSLCTMQCVLWRAVREALSPLQWFCCDELLYRHILASRLQVEFGTHFVEWNHFRASFVLSVQTLRASWSDCWVAGFSVAVYGRVEDDLSLRVQRSLSREPVLMRWAWSTETYHVTVFEWLHWCVWACDLTAVCQCQQVYSSGYQRRSCDPFQTTTDEW